MHKYLVIFSNSRVEYFNADGIESLVKDLLVYTNKNETAVTQIIRL